jgi:hypothetical protein
MISACRAKMNDHERRRKFHRADNWKPSKRKSVERIHGIVALVMAVDRATTQPQEVSVYEGRGLLVL